MVRVTWLSFHPVLVINSYIFTDIMSFVARYAWEEELRRLNLEEHGEGASKTIVSRLLFLFKFFFFLSVTFGDCN